LMGFFYRYNLLNHPSLAQATYIPKHLMNPSRNWTAL
jgi:hypothetical protein